VGLMEGEQRYGVEVADAAILGCAFTTRGELNSRGTWEGQYPGCPSALMRWALDERALRAQAVIVELGYRDEFDWRIRGRVVHLGQAAFDRYVQGQIDRYVQVLGRRGVPILFLSVPWSDPAALPDGSPAPAAAPARHTAINSMLQSAAARYPGEVRVLDIDKVVAPGNHYERTVDGKLCRFDGVHFTIFCSNLLQFDVLTAARTMLADVTSSRGA